MDEDGTEPGMLDSELNRRKLLKLGGLGAAAVGLGAFGSRVDLANSAVFRETAQKLSGDLTIWDPDTRADWVKSRDGSIASFTKRNPDVNVKVVNVPSDQLPAKVQAAFASNSLPDIIYMLPDYVALWGIQGIAAPLEDIFPKIGGRKRFYQRILNYNTYKGRTYSLPSISTPHMTFYRKDLYTAKGLKQPKTWKQYIANCKALHNPSQNQYGFLSFNRYGDTSVLISLLGCNDTDAFDPKGNVVINNPKTVEALEMLQELTALSPPGSTTKSQSDVRLIFAAGAGAHMHTSTSVASVLRVGQTPVEKFAAFPMPTNKGKRGAVSFWTGWCVSERSKNKDAAKALLAMFFRVDVYSIFARNTELGFLPTEPIVAESKAYKDNPRVKPFLPMFEQGGEVAKVGVLPGQRYGNNLNAGKIAGARIWTEMMDRIAVSHESPKSVAAWAEKAITAAIK